ncbi:MAG TPA: SDR family oxidoreductase [Pseudonocardiaceae bacterium]|nr:SDR family oxidoreductase [Pseudonocardiaceae bacterium]
MATRPLALVTGATRGIGAAVARELCTSHELLLGGRDTAALVALALELPGAQPWPVDLTDAEALAESVAGIDELDVLVHSAGTITIASLADSSVDVWRRTMELNVIAVAELTRLLLPALRAVQGRVVLVNSGQGLSARADWGAYAASKHALRGYAEALRAEEAEHGVRVTSVYPGRTGTDMQRGVREAEGGEYEPDNYLAADTVAAAVAWAVRAPDDAQVLDVSVRPAVAAQRTVVEEEAD